MKKGVSPVIATVLLIAITIVLAAIIFLWARGFISERVEKFEEPVDRACDRVDFEAGIFGSSGDYDLEINNRGNIPLYGFHVKALGRGDISVNEVFEHTLATGESSTYDVSSLQSDSEGRVLVVPVILGASSKGRVPYPCGDEYGVGVTVA